MRIQEPCYNHSAGRLEYFKDAEAVDNWRLIHEILTKILTEKEHVGTSHHTLARTYSSMYRVIYEMCVSPNSCAFLLDKLLSMADNVFDGLRKELEVSCTCTEWIQRLANVLENATCSVSLISSIFGYLDRSFVIPTHHKTLYSMVLERFRLSFVVPLHFKLYQFFDHVAQDAGSFQEATVCRVVEFILKMGQDLNYLHPLLFHHFCPQVETTSDTLNKYAELRRINQKIGVDLFKKTALKLSKRSLPDTAVDQCIVEKRPFLI